MTETSKHLKNVHGAFKYLSSEAREFYLNSAVPILNDPPSGLEFLRDWVTFNRPVLIRNVMNDWPALKSWNFEYLIEKLKGVNVSVAVTPNGYADAVYKEKFLLPEERCMKFEDVATILQRNDPFEVGIFYIQKQCSNLLQELSILLPDVAKDISFGSEAFGSQPDAVNFWMGDERAVTSMHKDNYENLYCVIRGAKTFTLIPPTDRPFVPYCTYPVARWQQNSTTNQFEIIDEEGEVPWVDIDPTHPNLDKYPEFTNAKSITVQVNQGELLYLPSLWFHHVKQSHGCIAVNYWYDMAYDPKFNYYQFLEKLINTC